MQGSIDFQKLFERVWDNYKDVTPGGIHDPDGKLKDMAEVIFFVSAHTLMRAVDENWTELTQQLRDIATSLNS